MASWREEYIQALQERDKREEASYQRLDSGLIDAFTKLLDRTAALEAGKAVNESSAREVQPRNPSQAVVPKEGNTQMRADLAEALRSNGQLQSRVKVAEAELARIKAQNISDSRLIQDLTTQRTLLSQKVRDRDEEIRGKAKLLDDVQDEMISLNLQLNMAEQRSQKLVAENKDLIDRWMAQKGQEADEMNKAFQDSLK
ncbi:autophagy protein [Coleophoma cylindrospora]|uniref:Autophagy protein n=1 Tax=Coleophoma cylindrospora TaxID=1849047 RepID=A0A3D8SQA3_9HELO|nr:autophagy protein [Coleophoma cylindrospora]